MVSINAITSALLSEKLKTSQSKAFLEACAVPPDNLKIVDGFYFDNSTGILRLLVPPDFSQNLIKNIHELGHFGRRRTYNTIVKNYFWPKMHKEINLFVKACEDCQRNKTSKKEVRT